MKKKLAFAAMAAAALLTVSCKDNSFVLDGEWAVVGITNMDVTSAENQPTIVINTQTMEYHGNTGINFLNGSFTLGEDEAISFGEAAMTKMSGSPESMEVEDMYIYVLHNIVKYQKVNENTMKLLTSDGHSMTLER